MALRKAAAGASVVVWAATEAVASGRLGFVLIGSIVGVPVLLACVLAVVAVFGTPGRQVRAERVLQLILRWKGSECDHATVNEPLSEVGPAPQERALTDAQDQDEAALVPITLGSKAEASGLRGLGPPSARTRRKR